MADYLLNGHENDALTIVYQTPEYNARLMRALNWYSYNCNNDDAVKYALAWVKKSMGLEAFKTASNSTVKVDNSAAWVCRLLSNGAILSPHHEAYAKELAESLLEPKKKRIVPPNEVKETKKDNLEEKVRSFIGEHLEGNLDTKFDKFDLLSLMKQTNTPATYLQWIEPWVKNKLEHFTKAYSDKDEGYAWSKIELRRVVQKLQQFSDDLSTYLKVKKENRKPRTVKKKTPSQLVAKLIYKKDFSELCLKSINACDIVGASTLWVYNTKTRKIGSYVALDKNGLSVKGSTLLNFKVENSKQKILRKPEELIPKLLTLGKVSQRTFLDEIKATDTELSGRINGDVILLRIY